MELKISSSSCLLVFISLFAVFFSACANISPHFDWDMAVAHGSNLTFISVDTNSSTEIKIPTPVNSIKLWGSNVTTSQKDWAAQDLMSLVWDSNKNLFFFNSASRSVASVAVFNPIFNITTLLFQSTNAIIDGLAYHDNVLYWTELRTQIIMTMNNTKHEPWESIEPMVFLKLKSKVHGIGIDPETGDVYWSNWSPTSTSSSIEYYNGEKRTLIKNTSPPQTLSIFGDFLYWTNRPYGVAFTIERIHLRTLQREVLYTGRHQAPFTVTPICVNSIMWTDLMSHDILIENRTKNSNSSVIVYRHYAETAPNGFVIRDRARFDERLCGLIGKVSDPEPEPETDLTEVVNLEKRNLEKLITNVEMAKPLKDGSWSSRIEWCVEADHCFNKATCISMDHNIFCICQNGYSGERCEITTLGNTAMIIICSISLFVSLVLALTSCYLWRKVRKLKRKPKIRRRVIVARSQQAASVSELIDIENCCNMNICETPCYETSQTDQESEGKRSCKDKEMKEDRKKLIDDLFDV